MAAKGEKRICSTCNQFAEVMELFPSEDGWYIQKLSCGHTGRIRIMDPIEERIEIKDEVKSVPIDHNMVKCMQTKPRRIQEVFSARTVDIEELSINS